MIAYVETDNGKVAEFVSVPVEAEPTMEDARKALSTAGVRENAVVVFQTSYGPRPVFGAVWTDGVLTLKDRSDFTYWG